MKSILSTNPTFTPGAANAGTLDFSAVNGFNIAGLLAVLNQTRGTLLYATGQSSTGYFSWNSGTKVLTLKVDTSTHSSGDQLQVIYDTPQLVIDSSPAVEGYSSIFRYTNAATTNATVVKASPGIIGEMSFSAGTYNSWPSNDGTMMYLKLYDKATTPTSADIPIFVIAWSLWYQTFAGGGGLRWPTSGFKFQNGISFRIVAGIADNNNTNAQAANSMVMNIFYV
jgi:hypothetical protein